MISFVWFPLFLKIILSYPSRFSAISQCNGTCNTLDDCAGALICINGKCNDDPDVGTHICSSSNGTGAVSQCNGPCNTLSECAGQLICINGKCNDDPDVGTHICSSSNGTGITTISQCNGPCNTPDDCAGELICINGACNDDPDVGTHICSSSGTGGCRSAGTLNCNGTSYPTYRCSPKVNSSTRASLTNKDFSEGGIGGGPSKCDGLYHNNSERIVALSTGWYDGGSRCGEMIRITASNGRSVTAKVVGECDSMNGCDQEHGGQPPCGKNIVDGSDAVWSALGLNKDVGVVDVTWTSIALHSEYYSCTLHVLM